MHTPYKNSPLLRTICIVCCLLAMGLLWPQLGYAQPANDNCASAIAIPLGGGNFDLGVYNSSTVNLTGATRQLGEYFDPVQVTSGNDKKTVWYRFTLPTHRGVRLELMQPANDIPQADVGFTVFYAGTASCLPGAAAIPPAKLTPLGKFGSTFNPCLAPGEYLVQVSAKDNAFTSDPLLSNIFLRLTTSYPDVLNNHDLHTAPYNFGTVSNTSHWNSWYDFGVGCLTREQTETACAELGANAADFTQSAWLTFRTDAAVDFMRFQIRMTNIITPKTPSPWRVGFRLFQGDATASATPWSSLSQIGSCTVLSEGADAINFPCTLLPNTTYSIQLFLHKDHESQVGVRMYESGIGQTESPLAAAPPTMSAAHQLGTLPGSPGGTWYTRTDEWSCNARMSLNPCGTVKPAAGYTVGSVTYDMNNWVTFTLTQYANVTFRSFSDCNNLHNRLYTGDVNNNCNIGLYSATEFQTNSGQNHQIFCLPPGTYSWQVLGRYGTPSTATCGSGTNSHLSQPMTISVNVANVDQQNAFDLGAANRWHLVNEIAGDAGALPDNVTVNSASDRFGCNNTRLPQDACPGNTKASYRILRIGAGQAGLLTISNLNTNFQYKLYQGDVRTKGTGAFPTTFNNVNFTDQLGCFNTPQTLCVTEGLYTLVSFGDATDVGRSDQPSFRFQAYESQFNLRTATRVNRVNFAAGNYVALVSGVTYTTTLDRFDCANTVLPASGVCNGASTTKAIYRQFRIGANGLLTVTGNCGNTYRLYRGDAAALATAQGLFDPHAVFGETFTGLTPEGDCFSGTNGCGWWGCNSCSFTCVEPYFCVEPGMYTLVTYTNNAIGNVGRTDQPSIRFNALDNQFNLANASRFNNINGGTPLVLGNSYTSTRMHFDCYQTVLPAGDVCGASHDRAQYRVFTLSVPGIVQISGTNGCFQYRLYQGNASTLATSFTFPNRINGLTQVGNCFSSGGFSQCLAPGTYTLVTFGDNNDRGLEDQPTISFSNPTTLFDDPTAGRVNTLGNLTAGGTSAIDYFSCLDNPRIIDGQAPCGGATKLLYREFEITTATRYQISNVINTVGTHRIFTGWASEPGGYANLQVFNQPDTDPDGNPYDAVSWQCFSSQTTQTCMLFPPGKYTLVTYGTIADLGRASQIQFSVPAGPPAPLYNRPHKAFSAGTTDWNFAGDGVAYPNTRREYNLGNDRFDCTKDLPNAYIDACTAPGITYNRTSYHVFTLTQEAYVRINNVPASFRMRVYPLDVRTADSLRMHPSHPSHIAPIQNCLFRQDTQVCSWPDWWVAGELELCRLQPGTYTLVLFGNNSHIWTTVQPRMVVEKVETTRFDHARNAYDFGTVPGDNVARRGRVGDTNPLHAGRAPSNDFFSCRAGAQPTDPIYPGYQIGGYRIAGQPSIPYPMPVNHALYEFRAGEDTTRPIVRRNVWYTFVIPGAGNVTVDIHRMGPHVTAPNYPWAIYESDVDATIPFASLGAAPNNVDSTLAQGLTLVASSSTGWCENHSSRSFFRDPCNVQPRRYFVLVDMAMAHEMNNQVEVAVRYDAITGTGALYDFYTTANRINGLNQTVGPYTDVTLTNGRYLGAPSDFFCYTTDAYDQRTCSGTRTMWYRVDINTVGRIRLNYALNADTTYNENVIRLFRDVTPGNPNALVNIPLSSITAAGRNWGEACISPGTYYIMMTDCGITTQTVRPQVWLINHATPYDNYADVNIINGLNQRVPPYTPVALTSGVYRGDTATFACATRQVFDQDPLPCGTRTLWWAFDVGSTGFLKANFDIMAFESTLGSTSFNGTSMELYREVIPGDPSPAGLVKLPLASVWAVNPQNGQNQNWGQVCYEPGRYFLKMTGCWYTTQKVVPRIWLDEHTGDYCTNAVQLTLGNNGSANAQTRIDCHTIGESFGEGGAAICGLNLSGMKSTWFEVDLNTTLKVDLTFRLQNNTNASSSNIRYRVNTGRCDAMTAGECNTDALTEFTLNCMPAGRYFVQVLTPETATGTIRLIVENTVRADQACIPPTLVVANFSVEGTCEDTPVQFTNQSTQGAAMKYFWNFGDGSPVVNTVNPLHQYPITGTPTTYTVSLTATDTVSGTSAVVTTTVTTYPRPTGNITRDPSGSTITAGTPIDFFSNAGNTILSPPTTYFWEFGDGNTSTLPNPAGVTIVKFGTNIVNLTITNGTCVITLADTFVLGSEPIFNGGPLDGADVGEQMVNCFTQLWPGGPFDGADAGERLSNCDTMLWVGGPFDGADMGELVTNCDTMQWAGGPFDGADAGEFMVNCYSQLWPGGPLDGADAGELNVLLTLAGAGNDTICLGQSVTLDAGAIASGGTYTYLWAPGGQTTASITVSPTSNTLYTLTMTATVAPPGNCLSNRQETFYIQVFNAPVADAGPDVSWCGVDSARIGTAALPGHTYSWSPTTYLSDPTAAQPWAVVPQGMQITYTVTATGPGDICPQSTDDVVVTTYTSPTLAANNDTTVCTGQNVTLTATGLDRYVWHRVEGPVSPTALAAPLANANFTASTNSGTAHLARTTDGANYWQPTVSDANQWLQIDLGTVRPIYQVQTGGNPFWNWYVLTFRLSFSNNGTDWTLYRNAAGTPITFSNASVALTTHTLPHFQEARYVRFIPLTWNGGIVMDAEVRTSAHLALNPATVSQSGTYVVHGRSLTCNGYFTDTVRVQTRDDIPLHYRSDQNGDWTSITTWEVWHPDSVAYDPNNPAHATHPAWVKAESLTCPTVSYPTSRSRTIQVRDSVRYNFTIPMGIDEVTIDPPSAHNSRGGILQIPLGITCFVVDSSASPVMADIRNNGRINIEGNFTPVGDGLLVNSDQSTVAYVRNGDQTMWDGQYGRLEADGSGIKTVGGPNTLVRTQVEFSGAYIQLNNRNLVLDTNATVVMAGCASGFFVTNLLGQVYKRQLGAGAGGTFTMPIGHSTASYNRATFTNTGTADVFGFRVSGTFEFHTFSPIDELRDTSSVNRTWHISEGVPGGSNVTLRLHWLTAHENVAFSRANSTVGRFDAINGWQRSGPLSPAPGAGTCASEYWQEATGITTLSAFSVGSCGATGLDYRSIANGDWTNLNTWEVYDPATASWYPAAGSFDNCGAVTYPTSASRTVNVRHKVRYDYSIPIGVDQVNIATTGHLWIPEGITLLLDTTGNGSDFVVGSNGSNGIDLHNRGRLEITGTLARRYTAAAPVFTNADASTVNYNGADQDVWFTSYANLWLDDSTAAPRPDAQTIKSLTGHLTEVREGLWFRNAKLQLGNYDCRLLTNCIVKTPGFTTGYMIATQNGYCRWEYPAGAGVARHFPIGGNLYSPALVTFDNVTTPGWLRGRVREQQHPLAPNPIHRFWTLDTTASPIRYTAGSNAGGYFGYVAQFYYNKEDLQEPWTSIERQYELVEEGRAFSTAYLEPNNWRLSTRLEIPYIPRVQGDEGVITNSAFSDFTFNPIEEQVLPVEDLVLRGMWKNNDAQLVWTTSREQNAFMFTLERSFDGQQFSTVTMRPAVGNSPVMQQYPHLDTEVADMTTPKYFYRVMLENLDGSLQYSNVVLLERDATSTVGERVRVYPNPVRSQQELLVDFTLGKGGAVQIHMTDMLGRRIYSTKLRSDAGIHQHVLPTQGLAVGSYVVTVVTPERTYNTKVLVFN